MFMYNIKNIKHFMSLLFSSDTFDSFFARQISLRTFTDFEISGNLNKTFLEKEEAHRFTFWKELRPIVYSLVKGTKPPTFLKIALVLPDEKTKEACPSASSVYLNILYENGILTLTSAISMKEFSLDKSSLSALKTYTEKIFSAYSIEAVEQEN